MAKNKTSPRARRPGIAGIVVGIILMVCGPVMGGGVIEYSTLRSASQIDAAQTFSSNGTPAQVALTGTSEMGIWITPGGHGSCQVYDPKLVPVPLSIDGFTRQSANQYDLAGTFTPTGDGMYTVVCSSTPASFTFKIAPVPQPKGSTTLIIAGVVIIVVVFLVGLALLVAMLIRRYGWHEDGTVHHARAMVPNIPEQIPEMRGSEQPAYGQQEELVHDYLAESVPNGNPQSEQSEFPQPTQAAEPIDLAPTAEAVPVDLTPVELAPADLTPPTEPVPIDLAPEIGTVPVDLTPTESIQTDLTSTTDVESPMDLTPPIESAPIEPELTLPVEPTLTIEPLPLIESESAPNPESETAIEPEPTTAIEPEPADTEPLDTTLDQLLLPDELPLVPPDTEPVPPTDPDSELPVDPESPSVPVVHPPQVWPPTFTEPPQGGSRHPQSPYGDQPESE